MNLSEHLTVDELETRIKELTAELEKANQALRAEVYKRKQTEEKLRENQEDRDHAQAVGKIGT
jgi:C4-dicarboxylate-specific signal transduction histidine kinase